MLYRDFGKSGEKISILGFGCMRLPILGGNMARIDEVKATEMIRYAIERGVNYVDTAWSYHATVMGQKGEGEPFVGRVLKNGYREKVNIATKLPVWLIRSQTDMEQFLNEQLERLQTEVIDFYLLHSLTKEAWKKLESLGVTRFLDNAIRLGKIRYAGFSFHDNEGAFREIIDSYNWSFCQIQYNYLDEEFQAGKSGLQYAAARGIAVVAMEPLRGGKLARSLPDEVSALFESRGLGRSPAWWAFRWAWNHPEIAVVLSGMNSREVVALNLETAGEGVADSLGSEDIRFLQQARSIFSARLRVNCTACGYCMPCPAGVNIPGNFNYYNDFHVFSLPEARQSTLRLYNNLITHGERPSACIECGQCEEKCPQKIAIIPELKKVTGTFG
jgi:predicted aldo/keto reductase-like oxidoreductase